MTLTLAYYNEFDPFAAAWLRELIEAGHIAPGVVDERSIEDVRPCDLEGFTQCHFFAGIGVWSYALRLAGWPDDRPVWTASCPCQPFSASGRQAGFADERHLWPHLQWLIEQRGPSIIFGEQVASKAAEPWIDLVQADLEAQGYAFGCVPFPSAGVGAPHIRDRAYWVADTGSTGRQEQRGQPEQRQPAREPGFTQGSTLIGMGNTCSARPLPVAQPGVHSGEESTGSRDGESERPGAVSGMANPNEQLLHGEHAPIRPEEIDLPETEWGCQACRECGNDREHCVCPIPSINASPDPGPVNGFWRDADWLFCRDGKWRPVEPGTFPLADGPPARVGRLRGYGNAINAEAARAWIEAVTAI